MDHGELAADLVCGKWIARFQLHAKHDVEKRSRRLDHHHVGALFDVLHRLAQRLVRVGDVHLVPATIAGLRRALRRLAKGAVERAGELRGVAENRRILEACRIERATNDADPPIHHVARGHDVRPGARVRQRLAHEQGERGVVVHVAVAQNAAVPMISVLAQADVGDDDELRQLAFECAHRLRHRAVVVPGTGALGVLARGNAEEQHAAHAERRGFSGVDQQLVH